MNHSYPKNQTTVFFDGDCPLCRKEIAHYQRMDKQRQINWLDITDENVRLSDYNLTFDQAMRQLQAINRAGNRVNGIEAFIAIWTELPGYRHLPGIIQKLYLQATLQWLYEKFAERRYRKRECGCNSTDA